MGDEVYRVELLNIPKFRQGTFDSMCTYYAGAMMLTALFPAYRSKFGRARTERNAVRRMSADPIIVNREVGEHDHRSTLARWFYLGEDISRMVDILNRIASADGKNTIFRYREASRGPSILGLICSKIDRGLPVMLGWDTDDYGCHAVLVTGYRFGSETWLLTNDPGGGDEVSWNSLLAQQEGRFQVGVCIRHTGPRPLKLRMEAPESDPVIYQWAARKGPNRRWIRRYVRQERLFPG